MDIIKGSDLMLFVKQGNNVKSIAFATSHTFTISADTADISTKDHGFWSGKEITRINWNIQTDNLYTVDEFNGLYDMMIARQPIPVYFCLKTPTERAGVPPTVNLPGDTATTWHPTTATGEDGYYGNVYITSLTANAAAGDNATFSATLDGIGALAKGLKGSVESQIGGSSEVTITTITSSTTVTYEAESRTDTYDSNKEYFIQTGDDQMSAITFESADEYNKAKQEMNIYTEKA